MNALVSYVQILQGTNIVSTFLGCQRNRFGGTFPMSGCTVLFAHQSGGWYTVDRATLYSRSLATSFANFEANCGPLSLMILSYILYRTNTFLIKIIAVFSAVIVFVQGVISMVDDHQDGIAPFIHQQISDQIDRQLRKWSVRC
jgi:hypothetical protein